MSAVTALALYSGGLDSILACRLLQEQGIHIRALQFVTPFSQGNLLEAKAATAYCARAASAWGIELALCDLSPETTALLRHPSHGFGRNFNPCIDCKILMMRRAREEMARFGASFLVSGEVVGQRPMSQRRDTLRVIARESGCDDILLRPLSAQLLPPTRPEREGLVERDRLLGLSGRGRAAQMALARHYGLVDFPEPAGGCLLTDPILGARIAGLYQGPFWFAPSEIQPRDLRLLLLGRQFRLEGGAWCILGRDEGENERLLSLRRQGDWILWMEERSGPLVLLCREGLRPGADPAGLATRQAASLVVRYGRKLDGITPPAQVRLETDDGGQPHFFEARAASAEELTAWRL
ncbi:MAG: hypothetical protein BWK76_26175 [Desulfobulbaceae bacterium A2]|nr:MAG: hypothetical protein BWK76_26175 [Desulfobulbaceae bacterium A2]